MYNVIASLTWYFSIICIYVKGFQSPKFRCFVHPCCCFFTLYRYLGNSPVNNQMSSRFFTRNFYEICALKISLKQLYKFLTGLNNVSNVTKVEKKCDKRRITTMHQMWQKKKNVTKVEFDLYYINTNSYISFKLISQTTTVLHVSRDTLIQTKGNNWWKNRSWSNPSKVALPMILTPAWWQSRTPSRHQPPHAPLRLPGQSRRLSSGCRPTWRNI